MLSCIQLLCLIVNYVPMPKERGTYWFGADLNGLWMTHTYEHALGGVGVWVVGLKGGHN